MSGQQDIIRKSLQNVLGTRTISSTTVTAM
jgi:hypothetical protein